MLQLLRIVNTLIVTMTVRTATTIGRRYRAAQHDERGEAVPWLIVLGAGIAIAYFAGDSVMAFAKSLVGQLGK